MFKTQSLPDETISSELLEYDEIVPLSHNGSPYAKRRNGKQKELSNSDGWTSTNIGEIFDDNHQMSDDDTKSVLTIYDYDHSPQGSPYTRRYPVNDRIKMR